MRRFCLHKVGVMPDDFEELTLPDVAMCLDHDFEKHRAPPGGVAGSHEQIEADLERLRRMTPRQRLEHYRNED